MRVAGLALLVGVFAMAGAVTAWSVWPPPVGGPDANRLVGFSFSPEAATWEGLAPQAALAQLLQLLRPDLVRLPVYWEEVAPGAGQLDFAVLDSELQAVKDFNAEADRGTRVILVIGARNLGYPEVHLPSWVAGWPGSLDPILRSADYRAYLGATIRRYSSLPELYAWQLENEPLDNVSPRGDPSDQIPADILSGELALVRSQDASHPVVMTTYNSSSLPLDRAEGSAVQAVYDLLPGPRPVGHMREILRTADVLGLDLYVETDGTPISEATVEQRIGWKEQTLRYWAAQARSQGKELWATEVQGEPWPGQFAFTPDSLLASSAAYRGKGAKVVLLWGAEHWLVADDWMRAGLKAMDNLRAKP